MDKRKIRRLITSALYSLERRDIDNARAILQGALDLTADAPIVAQDENAADDTLPAFLLAQAD